MRIIAITGGIGSGKTTVAGWIAAFGVPVIDADAISRRLTAAGGEALPLIREAFGTAVFHLDGTLDRKALAKAVFSDDVKARQTLNAIMHPMITAYVREKLDELERKGTKIAVIEVPLLYETGMDSLADTVVCVTASQETRIARVMARDGMTQDQAVARIRSQQDNAEVEKLADFVLSTDSDIQSNQEKTRLLWQRILSESEA